MQMPVRWAGWHDIRPPVLGSSVRCNVPSVCWLRSVSSVRIAEAYWLICDMRRLVDPGKVWVDMDGCDWCMLLNSLLSSSMHMGC